MYWKWRTGFLTTSSLEVHGHSIAGHTGEGALMSKQLARRKRGRILSKPGVAVLLYRTALLFPSNVPKQFNLPKTVLRIYIEKNFLNKFPSFQVSVLEFFLNKPNVIENNACGVSNNTGPNCFCAVVPGLQIRTSWKHLRKDMVEMYLLSVGFVVTLE